MDIGLITAINKMRVIIYENANNKIPYSDSTSLSF